MERKMRAAILVALLLGIACAECAAQQVEIAVDKRIRLEAQVSDADVFLWSLPASVPFTQEGGVIFIEESAPQGTYRAQVVALKINWESQRFIQQTGFVEFTVGPSAPDDDDDPKPGPDEPDDPPVPNEDYEFLVARIESWSQSIVADTREEEAAIIAKAFETFAGKASEYDSIAEFSKATSDQYKQGLGEAAYLEWLGPVFTPLADEFRKIRDANDMTEPEQYAPVWLAVAKGFREVANE